jgi:hypothetical protein
MRGSAQREKAGRLLRPAPPAALASSGFEFQPAQELHEWSRKTFIEPGGLLLNAEHEHLQSANVGFLWTNVPCTRKMRQIVGTAELPKPHSALGKWAKAAREYQLATWFDPWFGSEPLDFLITLYGPYAAECGDAEFCSLCEHELLHCAQALDEAGAPKFRKDGRPVFAMRGHDAEEFISIVRRYGPGSAAGGVAGLIAAAAKRPEIAAAQIAGACGTCLVRAA